MIDITERQIAEKKIDIIKAALISSQVDYYLRETPYTMSIHLKKKFLKDNSPKSNSSSIDVNLSPSSFSVSSPLTSKNDSGIFHECKSCESLERNMESTRKELVTNILEYKNKVSDHLKDIDTKNEIIK